MGMEPLPVPFEQRGIQTKIKLNEGQLIAWYTASFHPVDAGKAMFSGKSPGKPSASRYEAIPGLFLVTGDRRERAFFTRVYSGKRMCNVFFI